MRRVYGSKNGSNFISIELHRIVLFPSNSLLFGELTSFVTFFFSNVILDHARSYRQNITYARKSISVCASRASTYAS